MRYREQVSQFKLDQLDSLKDLDLTTQRVIDAIVQQQNVFQVAYDTQVALMGTIHKETVSKIQDEHVITRREIIQEIRVSLLSSP